jgi:hypothetical protein
LVTLACHLQAAPSLQVHPEFAQRLEQRILLHHHVALRQQQTVTTQKSWLFWRPLMAYISLAVVLVCSLLGSSVLALAAQTVTPSNPLYPVKKWEQQVQLSFAHSPSEQAEINLHIAQDRLNALANAHGEAYRQALTDLDGQMDATMHILNMLPAGQDHERFADDFAALKARARRTLRDGLLHRSLSEPERLATTDELRQLGDAVTQLRQAAIIFPSHSPTQATISLTGANFSAGGHVLIDQVVMGGSGMLQNGIYVFVVNWNGRALPHTVGILNADGTAAQTTEILFPNAKDGNAAQNDQGGNNKEKSIENGHASNSSSGSNGHRQNGNDQNGNTPNNGGDNHELKNNRTQPSP